MQTAHPLFIAIEGIDGCGKTSLMERLRTHIKGRVEAYARTSCSNAPDVHTFGAWAANEWTQQLRTMFVNGIGNNRTEMLLAWAARRALVLEKIVPELDGGNFVIADRFAASTLAYQSETTEDMSIGFDMYMNFCQGLVPGLTLYLNCDYQTARARQASRGEMDSIEKRGELFHLSLDYRYRIALSVLSKVSNCYSVEIDANRSRDAVFEQAARAFDLYFNVTTGSEISGTTMDDLLALRVKESVTPAA